MKYKIGDKVRIVKPNIERLDLNKEMLECQIGEIFEVIDIDEYDDEMPIVVTLDDERLWLYEDEFELVNNETREIDILDFHFKIPIAESDEIQGIQIESNYSSRFSLKYDKEKCLYIKVIDDCNNIIDNATLSLEELKKLSECLSKLTDYFEKNDRRPIDLEYKKTKIRKIPDEMVDELYQYALKNGIIKED